MGKYDEILVGYSSNPDGPPVFGGLKWAIHLVFFFWGVQYFQQPRHYCFHFVGWKNRHLFNCNLILVGLIYRFSVRTYFYCAKDCISWRGIGTGLFDAL